MPIRSLKQRLSRRSRRAGFSLAECAISLLLTSVVLLGALNAVSSTHRTRLAAQSQRQATELAQSLMTEILSASYLDPDGNPSFGRESGESGSNRLQYDDVDDYSLLYESPPKDRSGAALPGYSGWSRLTTIVWVSPNSPDGNMMFSETGLKRITVNVTDPNSKTRTLKALRSSLGIGEQQPVTATTFVTEANVDVTVGSATLSTGVNLANGAD